MANKKAVILYNQVFEDSPKDDLDVLAQVKLVSAALTDLGYEPLELGFSLSLMNDVLGMLKQHRPLFVFNLTESVEGDGQLIHLVPSLLDHLNIPYTGCQKEAMFITSSKLLTKKILQGAGIATPEWTSLNALNSESPLPPGLYIAKSVWEHASNWFDEASIFLLESPGQVKEILVKRKEKTGKDFFCERFIEGREFNLSILAGKVLPVPEMRFVDYPEDKRRVVDYRAKWEEGSFEYHHTVRCFDFPAKDIPLVNRLSEIALQCWKLFELKGYARVDFRVDNEGRPWVLEINSNPCIAEDSGFFAAVKEADISAADMVERIVTDSTTGH